MIYINKPTFSQQEILISCIDNLRNQTEKQILLGSANELERIYMLYDSLLEKNNIDLFKENVIDEEVGNLLIKMYENKFSKKGQTARNYYDKILSYNKSEICPYCKTAKANNLDHYLPKSKYPSLAINPLNLLPICFKCNDDKGTVVGSLVHLYYDNIQSINWLKCKLFRCKPLKLEFYVDKSEFEDTELFQKVNNTFERYNISSTYNSLAIDELLDSFHSFKRIANVDGYSVLKSDLKEIIKHAHNKNTWKYSLYNEISGENDWFYNHLMKYDIDEVF
ncbi:hypothetical protein ETI06_09755 [Macrococcoides goetzii]|nr:hypothetical protein [Macrococcus goetzii]TDM48748.1 hypothetical protein ETI06_09755 [Macrococcus goetzii]